MFAGFEFQCGLTMRRAHPRNIAAQDAGLGGTHDGEEAAHPGRELLGLARQLGRLPPSSWLAAAPVSSAPPATRAMLLVTPAVPLAGLGDVAHDLLRGPHPVSRRPPQCPSPRAADLVDAGCDQADRRHGLTGRTLDPGDLARNLARCSCGLLKQPCALDRRLAAARPCTGCPRPIALARAERCSALARGDHRVVAGRP